jgi:uncharacterized membrane protein (DUF4010 family)
MICKFLWGKRIFIIVACFVEKRSKPIISDWLFVFYQLVKSATSFWYIYKMKANKSHNTGSGIAVGSAIGVALGFALGKNASNTMQYIAMGLAIGAFLGAIIDFFNRSK